MTEVSQRDVPTRYGRAMLRQFGWFYRILGLGRALSQLRFEEHSVDMVLQAQTRGPVVYVMLYRSQLDYLALNTVLNRRRLPLARWVNGGSMFFWQPVAAAWRDVAHRVRRLLVEGPAPDAVNSGWLSRLVADGGTAATFLIAGEPWWKRWFGARHADPIEALVDAQAVCKAPIQLVPVVVIWDRAPERKVGQVRQFFQGNRDAPGFVGQLWNAWFRSPSALVQVGAPVDMAAFMWRVSDPIRRHKALTTLLRRYLKREATLVRGPRLLPVGEMKRLVLENPPMRDLVLAEANALGISQDRVKRQMSRAYDSIAADFRWWMVRLLYLVLRPLWTKVYAGVDVRPEDLERIRTAMRNGTAVIVPCHKSHFDYLLMSWLFYEHDLIVPHVVAGMNLAIWPVSYFLRGAGGFFIKRSFAGERVFPAVFSRYLRELIRQRYPVEFFIEGGRTRSGKLLAPKTGVLDMVLEAAEIRRRGKEVTILPVSICYEQVAEERVYAKELAGAQKEPESVGQLVRASSVLRRRYGRVYIRVGQPLLASVLVDQPPWRSRDPVARRVELHRIGERILYRIGQSTVLLATSLVAMALLAHHRRGIRQPQLMDRVQRFRSFLQRAGMQEAASLQRFDQAVHDALRRFWKAGHIESFDHNGERIWGIVPERRIALAFYKNQAMHACATAAFAAAAIRGLHGDGGFAFEDVRPGFCYLMWMLRREFRFDPDRAASDLLREGIDALVAHGALAEEAGLYRVTDPERMGEVFALVAELLEAHSLVLTSGPKHMPFRGSRADYAKVLQEEGGRLVTMGVISRPEALSLETLSNALSALKEEGILMESDGRLTEDEDQRKGSQAWLAPMVER